MATGSIKETPKVYISPLENMSCRLAVYGKLATLWLSNPKSVMTKDVEFNCGSFPMNIQNVNGKFFSNEREYLYRVANNVLYVTPLNTLPSDGKPTIPICIPLMLS